MDMTVKSGSDKAGMRDDAKSIAEPDAFAVASLPISFFFLQFPEITPNVCAIPLYYIGRGKIKGRVNRLLLLPQPSHSSRLISIVFT